MGGRNERVSLRSNVLTFGIVFGTISSSLVPSCAAASDLVAADDPELATYFDDAVESPLETMLGFQSEAALSGDVELDPTLEPLDDRSPADRVKNGYSCAYDCATGLCLAGKDGAVISPNGSATLSPAGEMEGACRSRCLAAIPAAAQSELYFYKLNETSCKSSTPITTLPPINYAPKYFPKAPAGACLGILAFEDLISRCGTTDNTQCMSIGEFLDTFGTMGSPVVSGSEWPAICRAPLPRCVVKDGVTLDLNNAADQREVISYLQSACQARRYTVIRSELSALPAGYCSLVLTGRCGGKMDGVSHAVSVCRDKNEQLCVKDSNCRESGKPIPCLPMKRKPEDCRVFADIDRQSGAGVCTEIRYTCPWTRVSSDIDAPVLQDTPVTLQCPAFAFLKPPPSK